MSSGFQLVALVFLGILLNIMDNAETGGIS